MKLFTHATFETLGGWFRLWDGGPGIAWTPAREPLLFSQRNGYEKFITVFGWRISYVRRQKAVVRVPPLDQEFFKDFSKQIGDDIAKACGVFKVPMAYTCDEAMAKRSTLIFVNGEQKAEIKAFDMEQIQAQVDSGWPHRYKMDADVLASGQRMIEKHRKSLEKLGR